MKKVQMKMPAPASSAADAWVAKPTADVPEVKITAQVIPMPGADQVMKRFTIDVTDELHKRIKSQCAIRGTKMADVIRELLEREFPAATA